MNLKDALLAKAKEHRKAAEVLEEAAKLVDIPAPAQVELFESEEPVKKTSGGRRKTTRKPSLRRDQIRAILEANGPSTRGEISKLGNIPTGTLATYLRPDFGFAKVDDTRWGLIGTHIPDESEAENAGVN